MEHEQGKEVEIDLRRDLLQRGLRRGKARDRLLFFASAFLVAGRPLHHRQDDVLLVWSQVDEVVAELGAASLIQLFDAFQILAADDLDALSPGLGALSLEPHEPAAIRPGIDVVDPGEVAIEKVDGAGFAGAWLMVGGNDASHRGFDGAPLEVVEESRLCLVHGVCRHRYVSRLPLASRGPSSSFGTGSIKGTTGLARYPLVRGMPR